jgi:hypothetical protein
MKSILILLTTLFLLNPVYSQSNTNPQSSDGYDVSGFSITEIDQKFFTSIQLLLDHAVGLDGKYGGFVGEQVFTRDTVSQIRYHIINNENIPTSNYFFNVNWLVIPENCWMKENGPLISCEFWFSNDAATKKQGKLVLIARKNEYFKLEFNKKDKKKLLDLLKEYEIKVKTRQE